MTNQHPDQDFPQTSSRAARRISRREWMRTTSPFIFAAASGSPALTGCDRDSSVQTQNQPLNQTPHRYRIDGPSMNPTLWGASRQVRCGGCEIETRIEDALLRRCGQVLSNRSDASIIRCWHCGVEITATDVEAWLSLPPLPPQTIRVNAPSVDELIAGDLVLLRRKIDDNVHVKRILATPGQTVSVDGAGRLLVDGERPRFDSLPQVLVDSDRHRAISRWRNEEADSADPASTWHRTEGRDWIAKAPTGWLVYEHHSVYRGDRPLPIQDDYPGNIGVQRKLYRVDNLSVRLELTTSTLRDNTVTVLIAFWSDDGIRVASEMVDVRNESHGIRLNASSSAASSPPHKFQGPSLSPTRPIAIAIQNENFGDYRIGHLQVQRGLQYRITRNREASPSPAGDVIENPIVLLADQWFVVGDNVPLSVDSRMWGCVSRAELIGRVEPPAF